MRRVAIAAAIAGATLTGCAAQGSPQETDVPTSSPVSAPAEPTPTSTDPYGGEAHPLDPGQETPPTEAPPTEAPPTDSTAPDPSASRVDVLQIGDDDYAHLDWKVTCGGLETAPTVLGTANGDDDTEYVFMLLASGSDQLISFTFSSGPANGGHASKTGLTVTPSGGQGNGTFTLDGQRVISDGRGISYAPGDTNRDANTLYTAEFTCGRDK